MRMLGFGVLVGGLALGYGCSGDSKPTDRACVPGISQSCTGKGACDGYQVCNDEGSAFGACDCDTESSTGASGAPGNDSTGTGGVGGNPEDTSAGGSGGTGGGVSAEGAAAGALTTTGDQGTTSTGGSTGGGSASGGVTSTTGQGGTGGVSSSTIGSTSQGGTGGTPECSEAPTVMILVDRSTSLMDYMFWDPLRDAVLAAVSQLESEFRFGLATFSGATCPLDLQNSGPIGLNNHQMISEFYTAITHPGMALQGPTPAAIHSTRELLLEEATNGRVAILLVTDGGADFCDSGAVECRADATVRVIQGTYEAGIDVLLAALPNPGVDQEWVTAFTNAGLGQPVAAPRDTQFCDPIPAATADLLSDIDPNAWPLATYGETMGPEVPVPLDASDVDAMTEAIVDLLEDWSACP